MTSSNVITALGTLILAFIWFCYLEGEVRKDYATAGYIVIDKTAYKIMKVEQ